MARPNPGPDGRKPRGLNQAHRGNGASISVHAPYNFVTLSGRVFRPAWRDRISHDVPFSDGICGTIDVELTAHTPLCVGDRKQRGADGQEALMPFELLGRPAIPGTAIRGMLRNVVEIASFAKMQFVDRDRRYAVRDLQNRALYTNYLTIERLDRSWQPAARAGWLRKDSEENWVIEECNVSRVDHADLGKYLPRPTAEARDLFLTEAGKPEGISGPDKYRMWRESGGDLKLRFTPEPPTIHNKKFYFSLASSLGSGTTDGTLVMTGQPNPKKRREFIFWGPSGDPIPLDKSVCRDFQLNHSLTQGERHGGQDQPNTEWGHWKPVFESGGRVPVFFLARDDRIWSFGLAQMFRLAYKKSIGDAIDNASTDHDPAQHSGLDGLDLADGLFGCVQGRDSAGDALRGRISVGMFTASVPYQTSLTQVHEGILNGPKPTFYPSYIKQTPRKDAADRTSAYKTLMDEDVEIRGWKRYPARGKPEQPPKPGAEQGRVASSWHAVKENTRFLGRLRLHNVRPAELGAVVWALNFGGRANFRHRLGYAKPFGFGEVTLRVTAWDLITVDGSKVSDLAFAVDAFREAMSQGSDASSSWEKSEQILDLLAMANPEAAQGHNLAYMTLGRGKSKNQFAETKRKEVQGILPSYRPRRDEGERPDHELYPRQSPAERKAAAQRRQESEKKAAEEARLQALSPADRLRMEYEHVLASSPSEQRTFLRGLWERDAESPSGMDKALWKAALREIFGPVIEEIRKRLNMEILKSELDACRQTLALREANRPPKSEEKARKRHRKEQEKLARGCQEIEARVAKVEAESEKWRPFLDWLDQDDSDSGAAG